VTEASDLYSIGIVLFEMLTGRAPFEGESAVAIALQHVNQAPPSVREIVPSIPSELEAVVFKALTKDSDQRYSTAESFIRDLDAVEARLDHGVDVESTAAFAPIAATATPATLPAPVPVAPMTAATVHDRPVVHAEVIDVPPPPVFGEPPPQEPPGRRRRWLLLLGIAGIAAIALAGYFALRPAAQVSVPLVIGQTLDSARSEIERAGLTVDVKRRADRAPRDIVFEQAPNPAQKVDDGSSVTIFVSNGPGTVKVPDVVGLQEADAKKRVRSAGLRPDVQRESSTKIVTGAVIRTDPSAGRPVDRSSTVTLVVSSGPEQVNVPDVVGQQEADAAASLRAKGLSPFLREKASSEPEGTVVDQSPPAGEQVDQGSTVTLYVSNGKVKDVPDVIGLNADEARVDLEDAGFKVSVRTRPTDQPDEDGTVLSQAPRGGGQRPQGSTVTITVGALTTTPPGPTP
jgi:serine/threonine-protein kinase